MPLRQCKDALPSQLLGRRRWKQQPLLWTPASAMKMLGERPRGAMLADASLPPKAVGAREDKATEKIYTYVVTE